MVLGLLERWAYASHRPLHEPSVPTALARREQEEVHTELARHLTHAGPPSPVLGALLAACLTAEGQQQQQAPHSALGAARLPPVAPIGSGARRQPQRQQAASS